MAACVAAGKAECDFQRQISNESHWTTFSEDVGDLDLPTPLSKMPGLREWEPVASPQILKERYRLKEHLGAGSFASVLVGRSTLTKEKHAIKILPLAKLKVEGLVDATEEVGIAGQMQHPYIVFVYDMFRDEDNIYLAMELCKGGDLFTKVTNWPHDPDEHYARRGLPLENIGRYMWQMLMGIAYLHHHHIVHRDIKLDNYMLKSRQSGSPLKLLDFGFSCKVEPGIQLTKKIGTPYYMAPEVQRGVYTEKCDIYGIGVCSFFMCTASFPYNGDSTDQIMTRASEGKLEMEPKVWSDVPKELKDLVVELLSLLPPSRPSARQIVTKQDSWLRRVGWNPKETMLPDAEPKPGCCLIS